ncbi:hypothetical protein CAOG_02372 [Capsaspora owczarzaki ATCC 30864]|uniref:hypothetical protein n=1 Tax=Capsaspora owczarzaki (strain ATCC 30864) TaxID=595528 RepID=UPI0001FE44FC|nr:hypothetical protein CAOG_02372 [Capsaspora owczarzaki ATCC 30864]|eukprot:XP_004349122.1 hypothetical protein CAOG_02372 [Capsaspora owczarzaki ATCC 30864]
MRLYCTLLLLLVLSASLALAQWCHGSRTPVSWYLIFKPSPEADFMYIDSVLPEPVALTTTLSQARMKEGVMETRAAAEAAQAKTSLLEAETLLRAPFAPESGLQNIAYLGRGYDVVRGNPQSTGTEVDPGIRASIMVLEHAERRMTADGKFYVPDNVDVIMEPVNRFESSSKLVRSEQSYKTMLESDLKIRASASYGPFAKGSFSASESYQQVRDSMLKRESMFLDSRAETVSYRARLEDTLPLKLTGEFRHAVQRLTPPALFSQCCITVNPDADPDVRCFPVECSAYDDLLETFGTHYMHEVTMGGRGMQRFSIDMSEAATLDETVTGSTVATEISGGFGAFSASIGFDMSMKLSQQARSMSMSSTSKSTEWFIGGEPGLGQFSADDLLTSLKDWARTVGSNPVPIRMQVAPIIELLDALLFPEDPHIADKQTLLASYLASYCESVSGANCGDGGDRDFTGDETVLRYGDFVTLDQLTGVNEGYRLRATTAAASAPSAISSQVSALSSTSRFLGVRLDYSNATHDFPMQTYEGDSMSFQIVALRIERFCSCMYASNDYNSIRFQSRFPPILISQKPSYKFSVVGNEGSCPYSTLQVESLVLNKDQFEGFPGLEARCRAQCTRMATCVRYTVRITADGDGMCTMFPSQTENMFAYSRDRSDKVFYYAYDDDWWRWSCENTKPGDWARDQASASFQVVERFAFSTRENHFFRIISPLLLTTLDKQPVFYGDELHLVSVDGSITLGAGNKLESVDQGSNTTLPPMRFKIYGRNSTFGTPVRRSERVMLQTMPDSQNEYFRKLTGNFRFNTYIPMFLQLATSAPVAPSGGTQLDYSMLRIMKPFPLSVSRLSAFEWVLNKAPKLDTPAADNVLSFIKQPTMAVTVLQPFSALEMTSNTNGTVVLAVVFSDPVVRTSVPPPQFVGLDWIRPKRLWPNNFAVRLLPTVSSVGTVTGNVTNVVYEEAQLQVHLVVTVTFGQQLAVGDIITTTAVNVEGANEQPIFQPTQAVQLNFEPVFQLAFVQWNVTNTTTVLAPFDTLRVATVRADFSEPVFSAASGGSLDVSCFALLGFDVASSGVFAANATILAVTLVPGSNSTAYLLDLSYFQLGPYDSPLSAPMYYVFPTGAGIITRGTEHRAATAVRADFRVPVTLPVPPA